MKKTSQKIICNLSFLVVLIYYFGISLFVEFLHKADEDPSKYHDDCPVCNWERQSQDTNQTTSAAQVCLHIHQTFVHFISIPEECSNFQSIVLANPLSRAPPAA